MPNSETNLTQAKLKELISYEPETGIISWLPRGNSAFDGRFAGKIAGTKNTDGYIQIGILYHHYLAHDLAWLFMTGEWPLDEIDHKNLIKTDNRWSNLRAASVAQNRANSRKRSHSKQSLKGSYRRDSRWRAYISMGGKRRYLGSFDCPAAAHFAYVIAADRYFGEFARAA